LDDGYTITGKVLLARCPIPAASKIPVYRLLVVALEAVFACWFWAMYRRVGHDYGFNELCPWPISSFAYDGCCSHNPLREYVYGDIELTEEQLQQDADDIHAKNIAYGRVYHKRQREEATPEFKAAQARANKKARPKTQALRVAAREAKTFLCALCEYAAGDQGKLNDHNKTKSHLRKQHDAQQGLTQPKLTSFFISNSN